MIIKIVTTIYKYFIIIFLELCMLMGCYVFSENGHLDIKHEACNLSSRNSLKPNL